MQLQDLVQALLDAKQPQWFDDVVMNPQIEGLLDGLHIPRGSHHDDVGFAVVAAQAAHPLKAGAIGQGDIHQQQLGHHTGHHGIGLGQGAGPPQQGETGCRRHQF